MISLCAYKYKKVNFFEIAILVTSLCKNVMTHFVKETYFENVTIPFTHYSKV